MANTWNTTTLNLTKFSTSEAPITINEQKVLPDPTDMDATNTFMSGAGSARTKYSLSGHCTVAELAVLIADKRAYTSRTLTIYAGVTQLVSDSCIITSLNYNIELADNRVLYDMELIEA